MVPLASLPDLLAAHAARVIFVLGMPQDATDGLRR